MPRIGISHHVLTDLPPIAGLGLMLYLASFHDTARAKTNLRECAGGGAIHCELNLHVRAVQPMLLSAGVSVGSVLRFRHHRLGGDTRGQILRPNFYGRIPAFEATDPQGDDILPPAKERLIGS